MIISRDSICSVFRAADIAFEEAATARRWDLAINDDRFYRRVAAGGSLAFGESYVDGWWDCERIDEMIFRLLSSRTAPTGRRRASAAVSRLLSWFVNPQTVRRGGLVARRHYDLGNDFFQAMLDPAMQYSCAVFEDTTDLACAQRQKMELICRKLGLEPGMRLLDVGCGWGGLARHAAREYGCAVTAVTNSQEQAEWARQSVRGLPVEVLLADYREVDGTFDRIVSVGMVEHVGSRNYRRFMEVVARLLGPGGLFLCHSITRHERSRPTDPWISRYIFPNSELPTAAQLLAASEGLFVSEDAHGIGPHYDPTLLAWNRNVHEAWPRFRERYGERFLRMWRYYLLSCAGAFRARDLQVFQFVLSNGGVRGGYRAIRSAARGEVASPSGITRIHVRRGGSRATIASESTPQVEVSRSSPRAPENG